MLKGQWLETGKGGHTEEEIQGKRVGEDTDPQTLKWMPDNYSSVVSQAAEDKWIYHRGSAEHAK